MTTPYTRLVRLGQALDSPLEADASRALLQTTILLLLAAAGLAWFTLGRMVSGWERFIGTALLLLIALLGQYLLARNRPQACSRVLVWGAWAAVCLQAGLSGGVLAPAVLIFPVAILMAGWMLRTRAALVLGGLSIAATWALVWAHTQALLPPAPPTSLALFAGVQSVVYGLSVLLVMALVRVHQNRLRELHRIGSDLHRRTEDLEASKAALDRAQSVATVGSWTYDFATDTMRLSAEACRILGFPPGSRVSNERYLAQTHPQDREAIQQDWQTMVQRQDAWLEHEHRLVTPDGPRWVRQKAQLRCGADGATESIDGIVQDITQHKQTQRALQDSEERYRTMIEWSPDPILVHREELVLYVNAAAIKMFGARQAHELVGQRTHALIHPDSLETQRARMHSISQNQPIAPMVECKFLRLDGSSIEVQVQGTAIVYDGAPAIHVSIRDITEHKASLVKIHELAFFDQLTGLPNRTLLLDRLRQSMAARARSGSYCALLFTDLDNFKTLNDTLGHDMGDVLLQQVAQRISRCVRAQDTVGRLGGDEFVVLLTNLSMNEHDALTQTEATGEKIRAALNRPYQLQQFSYHCTPSIGATLFTGPQATVDDVLKQADMAMYKAKAAGRNALRFFDTELEQLVRVRASLEADLRQAVQHKQFVLHYQPQLGPREQVVGVEALLRWQHPTQGLLLPTHFIPLAEENGLILPLGQWVLELACHQLAQWAQQPEHAGLTMSVNISPRQFHQYDFASQLQALLARTGVNPQRLILEITETLLTCHVEEVLDKMAALKALGVGFALDDFGTGYSSLSCLSRLPLDLVKIDQSFVGNLESNPNAAAICAATIGLAHSLKLKVVAEGVETEAQRHFLHTVHGCDLLQGHWFSRALPLGALNAWLQARAHHEDQSQLLYYL